MNSFGKLKSVADLPANEIVIMFVKEAIDLNERGHTRYHSSVAQTISSVPVYGRLYLTNTNGGLKDKTMDGPVSINDLCYIDNFNNMVDNGFQITATSGGETFRMDPDSQLTLGTAASATLFPAVYADNRLDLNHPSLIVYNSGLNQTVKSIAGTGDARYSNLTFTNAAGVGTPIKTLEGNIIVRGDITINANNEVDVDVADDYNIELQGDWINSGDFDEHQGLVNLTGSAAQTITSGGTEEGFYDFTITNTNNGGVTIEDDISIANVLTFSDGVIYEGAGGNELVTVEDGATVTGALVLN